MAANRESTGLQVALILCVMITVALSVTTFVYYKAADKSEKEVVALRDEAARATDGLKQIDRENQAYRYMIAGVGSKSIVDEISSEDFLKVRDQYQQDMDTYAGALPEEERIYSAVPGHLLTYLQQRNEQIAELNKQITEKNNEITAVEAREKQSKDDALKQAAASDGQLADERRKFNEARATFTKTISDRDQLVNTKNTEIETLTNKEAQLQDTFDKTVNKAQQNIDNLKTKIKTMEGETFEIPDGRVTWVNQRDGFVWISVGLADGLRRQTTFSIYNQDENGIDVEAAKGSIEVTRLIDQHLAEARIIDLEAISDPILPGDVIFSPVWRPGRRLGFALAGLLDIDDDGRSDRDLVRNLITMNGGVIHAEAHDNGEVTGAITHNTRYIVIGEKPDETSDAAVLAGYSRLTDSGRAQGTQELTLDQLLSLMGWEGQARTVNLGRGAREEDFLPDLGTGGRGYEHRYHFRCFPSADSHQTQAEWSLRQLTCSALVRHSTNRKLFGASVAFRNRGSFG